MEEGFATYRPVFVVESGFDPSPVKTGCSVGHTPIKNGDLTEEKGMILHCMEPGSLKPFPKLKPISSLQDQKIADVALIKGSKFHGYRHGEEGDLYSLSFDHSSISSFFTTTQIALGDYVEANFDDLIRVGILNEKDKAEFDEENCKYKALSLSTDDLQKRRSQFQTTLANTTGFLKKKGAYKEIVAVETGITENNTTMAKTRWKWANRVLCYDHLKELNPNLLGIENLKGKMVLAILPISKAGSKTFQRYDTFCFQFTDGTISAPFVEIPENEWIQFDLGGLIEAGLITKKDQETAELKYQEEKDAQKREKEDQDKASDLRLQEFQEKQRQEEEQKKRMEYINHRLPELKNELKKFALGQARTIELVLEIHSLQEELEATQKKLLMA